MKFTIKKIIRKEVDTKFGKKWKLSVLTDRNEWVSSFANKYTHEWREGSVVDVPTKTREYQGKTYIDCDWPKENQGMPSVVSQMDGRLDEILRLVKDIHNELWERKPKKEMDIPANDHTTEEVPFDPEERQPEEF